MSGEKGASKADTLVKVVLVFFISLLSFSVGTFVGKQVSDSDHRRMALEGEYKADRNVASAGGEGHEAEASGKISEKEVESLTEEFVNKEKAAAGEEVAETKGHGGAHASAHTKTSDHHEATEKTEHADAGGYKAYDRKTAKAAETTEHGEHH